MTTPVNPLAALSGHVADAVERAAASVVAVLGRGRHSSSGFIFQPGVIVTASDALERDEDISLILPGGDEAAATFVGRDATTDIAVLRIENEQIPAVAAARSGAVRTGELALYVGRRHDGPSAGLAVVAVSGGPWQSQRGGRIDRTIRLDRGIDHREEGGVLIDSESAFIGMAVPGPRRTALAIPAETIARVVPHLIAHGRVARGYVGLGLHPVRLDEGLIARLTLPERRGVIVVNIDPEGPGHAAGLLIGDIVVTWNGEPVRTVRETLRRLGPDAVGHEVDLGIVRGGEMRPMKLKVGERPAC
jgi:S1-C subfamily serine protease